MKKVAIVLMTAFLLLSTALSAHATEAPDPNGVCTLTMVMEWDGEKLSSGSLTVFRVGQIVSQDGDWKFALIPELQESDFSMNNLDDSQLATQLYLLVQDKELTGVTVQIQDGQAVFTDLTAGLYLVTQEEACEGFSTINPFLISLPRWNGNHYVYDLTAQPKVSFEPEETEPTEPTETEPTEPTDPVLPQTGQLNWPIPAMSVAGMALFLVGLCLCFGKKNGHES